MKVRNDKVVHTVGTLKPADTVRMSIDEASIAHIMSVLTDLYSDPALAVIREYSTNALDSHCAAGNTDPIEIELPSHMRRSYVVRDHGVGMNHDEIRDHFSKYGASSKRETNDEVGVLGLGCKSALTYTNQFTLTAVKGGVKMRVIIGRDDDGVGMLQVMDTKATDESNGVEIEIPISDINAFNAKAKGFFQFWEKGTVLINGAEPDSIFEHEEALKLDDDLVILPTGTYIHGRRLSQQIVGQDYVVMGNIAYPCQRKISEGPLNHSYATVVRIDIGEIDFTPSRESLHYTKHTTTTLQAISKFVADNLLAHVQKEVNAKATKFEGAREALRWQYVASNLPTLTYKGVDIPSFIGMKGWQWRINSYNPRSSKCERIEMQMITDSKFAVVHNHPVRSMDQRLKNALQEELPNDSTVIAISSLDDPAHEMWLEGCKSFEYDDLHPKLARQKKDPNAASVPTFKWSEWYPGVNGGRFEESNQPLTTAKVAYVLKTDPESGSLTREQYRKSAAMFIDRVNSGSKLGTIGFAVVRKPELDRFVKLHPGAVEFTAFLQELFNEIDGKLTDDQLAWQVVPSDLSVFKVEDVLDPGLQGIINRVRACLTEDVKRLFTQRKEVLAAAHQIAQVPVTQREFKSDIHESVQKWRDEYPLALHVRALSNMTACLECVNAVYTYREDTRK